MPESNYEVIQIGEGSWRIEDGVVRAFLFAGIERALLVDTGFGTGNIKKVVQGLTGTPVILVNTHGDDDHIGCNALFEEAFMHPAEMAFYFENAPADAVVRPLWEGDIIELGGRCFEVIHIPGHTPGSIALLDRDARLLVSGDSLSDSPIFMFGRVRNIRAYIASMEKLKKLSGLFEMILPSHGPCPLTPDKIDKLIDGAQNVAAGNVPPQEPPFDIPAKLYASDGAAFFWHDPAADA